MDVRGCLGLDDAYRNGFTAIRGTFTITGDAPRPRSCARSSRTGPSVPPYTTW